MTCATLVSYIVNRGYRYNRGMILIDYYDMGIWDGT